MLVVLLRDITLVTWDNIKIVIKRGEKLYVDVKEYIAYGYGMHFDISPNEYICVQ